MGPGARRRVVECIAATLAAVALLAVGGLLATPAARASHSAHTQADAFTISVEDLEIDDVTGEGTVILRLVPQAHAVAALTVDVLADLSLVQPVDASPSSGEGLCAFSNGVVRFAGFTIEGWSAPIDLCTITYRAVGTAGTGAIEPVVRNAVSTEEQNGLPIEIEGQLIPGSIRVGPAAPTATPTPTPTSTPQPGAVVDPFPSPTPEPTPTSEPTATPDPTDEPSDDPTPTPTATEQTEATPTAEAGADETPEATTTDDMAGTRGARVLPEPSPTPPASPEPQPTEAVDEDDSTGGSSEPADDAKDDGDGDGADVDVVVDVDEPGSDDTAAAPQGDDADRDRTMSGRSVKSDEFPTGAIAAVAAALFVIGGGLWFANGRRR